MRLPREFIDYGHHALLLNWEQCIDPAINAGVHAYAAHLSHHPAVTESVPAYCSLLVIFDSAKTNHYKLREWIYAQTVSIPPAVMLKTHRIPVVYGGEFGPDLEEVCRLTHLSPQEVIQLHTSTTYRVYQLGYQPGFPFLGLTDAKLEVARRSSPRGRVPAGSVGLAGRQTGIYPQASPGGWQLIGRCPWGIWRNEHENQARFKAGDAVQFYAIEAPEWSVEMEKAKQLGWPIT